MIDYAAIWEKVEALPWCALVTTGRTGSDFFQSLLDSHPEVFVFNGALFFHEFWEKSRTTKSSEPIDPADVADEFIGKFIHRLKSRYDISERKDELGDHGNQSINIDTAMFRLHLLGMARCRSVDSKHFLQSVYVAYALCLGQEIEQKKLFFHHIHHMWKLPGYLSDFPGSKIISMTRDPRATYVSGVEHWRKNNPKTDHAAHALFVLKRTINDANPLMQYGVDFRALRLEDLGKEAVLKAICQWLCISFDPCLKQSTWAGLQWRGDRLSSRQTEKCEKGFSTSIIKNSWETKLGKIERLVIDYLIADRLAWYGYPYVSQKGVRCGLLMLLSILLPTTYERRFLSIGYLFSSIRNGNRRYILLSFSCYVKRVCYFYQLFWKKHFSDGFSIPYFKP